MSVNIAQPPRAGRGCLFYGCIVATVLALVLSAIILFVVRYGIKQAIDTFTTTKPAEISVPAYEKPEAATLIDRFEKLRTSGTDKPQSFSVRELNILLAEHPKFKSLPGRAEITTREGVISINFSISLGAVAGNIPGFISSPDLASRYVNGLVAFKINRSDIGNQTVEVTDIKLNGSEAPDDFKGFINDYRGTEKRGPIAEIERVINDFGDIEVKDGGLIVHPKNSKPNAEAAISK